MIKATFVVFALLSLLVTPSIAQTLEPSEPNRCMTMRGGENDGDYVCLFWPTTDNRRLVLFPNSVKRLGGSADFIYIGSSGQKKWAQVDCIGRRTHWHVFTDERSSFTVPIESYAAQRMVNYICDLSVSQIRR